MKLVYLGPGLYAQVDDEDFWKCCQHSWYPKKDEWNTYATGWVNGRSDSLHRFVMGFPTERVDHIDGNGLNCQKTNLRIVTHAQNMMNRKVGEKPKGVYYRKSTNRYLANIKFGGKQVFIGSFKTEEEAARAYDRKAIEFHGEYACLNYPETK